MALVVNDCVTAIVDRMLLGQNMPADAAVTMKNAWVKIIDELFKYILANLEVAITIPNIPEANFTVNLTADANGVPVTFTVKTISDTTVPTGSGTFT